MIRNIDINKVVESNILNRTKKLIIVETQSAIKGLTGDEKIIETDCDYVELILDDNMCPIYVDGLDDNINTYKEVLKDAKYYLLALRRGSNKEGINYILYKIMEVTDNMCMNANEEVAIISVSFFHPIFIDVVDDNRLKELTNENEIEIIKMYFKLLKTAMDIKSYGKEYVTKNLLHIVYEDEANYAKNILRAHKHDSFFSEESLKRIYISKNREVVINNLVILDDSIVNMVDERELYTIAMYDETRNRLTLSYPPKWNNAMGDVELTIECERDINVRNIIKNFINICKGEN